MSPFVPSGDQARWRVIYGLLTKREVGDLLTYEEMAAALNLDSIDDRHTIQLAMRRAAKEFEEVDKHAVDSVVNEGYRIVEPNQHLGLAQRHQRKSSRSLVRGQSKVVNVDFDLIDAESRKAFEVFAAAFAAQIDFNRRMDVRQKNLERAVEAVTQRASDHEERTAEELASLQERLKRLEEKTSGSE